MLKSSLLALRGNVTQSKGGDSTLDIRSLVRAKKEATGHLNTHTMDINEDGVVDNKDIAIIRKRLLNA